MKTALRFSPPFRHSMSEDSMFEESKSQEHKSWMAATRAVSMATFGEVSSEVG